MCGDGGKDHDSSNYKTSFYEIIEPDPEKQSQSLKVSLTTTMSDLKVKCITEDGMPDFSFLVKCLTTNIFS